MSATLWLILIAAVIFVMFVLDFWLDRLFVRVVFKIIDRMPPWRPNGRYRSGSMAEKYSSLRKPTDDR